MDFDGDIKKKNKKKTNLEKYPPVCFGAAVLAGGEKCFLLAFPPGSESSPPVFGGCCWVSESASPLHTLTHTQAAADAGNAEFQGRVVGGRRNLFMCVCVSVLAQTIPQNCVNNRQQHTSLSANPPTLLHSDLSTRARHISPKAYD